MKAFLGMGLLGSNFVKAMINRGEEVQVWNRTASKAKELENYGAKAFANVAEAVKGAELIHVTLRDDASVDEVLSAARSGISAGTIIVDHTTTSKEGAIRRTEAWKEKGIHYQHAPVFMGPANALEGSGFMLVSGDEEIINRLQPDLTAMTGRLLHFGKETGRAAAMKLAGNTFLVCFTAGVRDTLCMAKALDVPVSDLFTLFESWNPGAQLLGRLKRLSSGEYSNPSWELNMSRKDTGLFMEAATNAGVELALIPGAAALMDHWIKKGYGHQDWSVIAKDCV